MPKNNILKVALVTGVILLIPLMFTLLGSGVDGQGWHWTLGDFLFMGSFIFVTLLVYELTIKPVKNNPKRICLAIILLAAFLLIWVELAVGILGTPFAGS